jgi:hypothetical protein
LGIDADPCSVHIPSHFAATRSQRLSTDREEIALGYWTGALLMLALLATGGCAAVTRSGGLGLLAQGERLVTLVVSEDPAVVRGECPLSLGHGAVLGCQTSRQVDLAGGRTARVVKIVRFTDRVPSALAFEIDIHELCHAVAALQPIDDPCHAENGGVVGRAAPPRHLLAQ